MAVAGLGGKNLGAYELRDLLGEGGMGAVYRAYQATLEREVAIKVLSSSLANEPDYIQRFNREAKLAATLEHTHIVPVYDYGTQDQISYVVMRLLTGGSLEQRLKNGPPPTLEETSSLLDQLASALDYAHRKGVIHRDIKTANVMFDDMGSAYLVDFGIAKLLNSPGGTTTHAGLMGTTAYMAPEQWREEEVTRATDLYALGVLVYATLTGKLPFEASTPHGFMHKHLHEKPTPPQTWRPDLPEALKPVLERALAKNPADRYPSASEFAQAFKRAISSRATMPQTAEKEPPRAADTTSPPPTPPSNPSVSLDGPTTRPPLEKSAKNRRPLLLWAIIVVIGVVVLALFARFSPPSAQSPTVQAILAAAEASTTLTPRPTLTTRPTDKPVVTAARTVPPSDTPQPTEAPSFTPSPTPSPTDSATPTPTNSPTKTPTATATATSTSSATPTPTSTPSDTSSSTPTATATPSATATPTDTPTATLTPTPTPTATATTIPAQTSLQGSLTAGQPAATHTFAWLKGDVVSIQLTAIDFDPSLSLADSRGNILAENDDCRQSLKTSCIELFQLPSEGDYVVAVSGFNLNSSSGGYTLAITYFHACASDAPFVIVSGPAGEVNLRLGPGTSYTARNKVQKNDCLVVIGRNGSGSWLKIRTAVNTAGWISATLVTIFGNVDSVAITQQ